MTGKTRNRLKISRPRTKCRHDAPSRRGLKHIYVYYLGTPRAPENIKLYEPYNNRECLHCHAGARSFEEGAVHTADPDLLPALKANKTSCISSGCHDVVHDVRNLRDVKFWKGGD